MDEYNKNTDFKHYVDAYCVKHEISVEEALTHEVIRNVEQFYRTKRETTSTN